MELHFLGSNWPVPLIDHQSTSLPAQALDQDVKGTLRLKIMAAECIKVRQARCAISPNASCCKESVRCRPRRV